MLSRCLCLLGATALGLGAIAAPPQPETIECYVVLDGPPSSSTYLALRDARPLAGVVPAVQARKLAIAQEQKTLEAAIVAQGGAVLGRFDRVANALRVKVPAGQLASVAALPGVLRLEPRKHYLPDTDTSVPFIGATNVWVTRPEGVNGQGIRLGIIDTGIDYLHASFGGAGDTNAFRTNQSAILEPGTFPTARVVGGYDFVGDNYNGANAPQPDPDPLDCNGHGTHVAGIAAGQGTLTNRTAYTGPFPATLDRTQFLDCPGVAPRASLYALKVFGCSGSTDYVLDALEWASDPNGDGDFSDRLDVLNLSLGSPFGLATEADLDSQALNTLAELGCVSAVSAGNSGNTFFIVSSPGTAERVITVANSIDDGTMRLGVQVLAPSLIATTYLAAEAVFTPPLANLPALVAEVAYANPNLACTTLVSPPSLAGKIALMDRGSCNFTDKILRAQAAGAVGVIMVNNAPGEPVAMGGTPGPAFVIPAVMISQGDGAILKAQLGAPVVARLAADSGLRLTQLTDQIETSTSRGPAGPGSRLKPDLAAPGSAILAARVGSGFLSTAKTGTSMAAPHIAGCLALLRQLHPDWPADDLKAALMNTARPLRDAATNRYAESLVGAGRVQVDEAARTGLTAKSPGRAGEVGLSFGALELTSPLVLTQQVLLRNFDTNAVTVQISVSNTVSEDGFSLIPLATSLAVPALGTALAAFRLEATPALFDRTSDPTTPVTIGGKARASLFEASGAVWFHGGVVPVHVPYHASLRAASRFAAYGTAASTPSTNGFLLTIPLAGASAHPQPLVSVFQLGCLSPRLGRTNAGLAVADLLAVGAASDAPARGSLAGATVYFAIAAAGDWNSPSGFDGAFNVEVDTNADGTADFVLRNSSAGNYLAGLANGSVADDVFVPVLRNQSLQTSSTNRVTNAFPPNQRDTVLFNNSVLVLPVAANALGLDGVVRTGFRYRVTTEPATQVIGGGDTTPWMVFDAARPLVDITRAGLANTPFVMDGAAVTVVIDPAATATNGLAPAATAGVLLLHHHNLSGTRAEMVEVRLDTQSALPLRLLEPSVAGGGAHVLRWTSSAARTYSVLRATNLTAGFTQVVATGLPGTPPFNTFTNTSGTLAGTTFYRVRAD